MRSIYFIVLVSLLTSGCTTYHGIANFSEESSIYLKPAYRDTIVKAKYISASFNKGNTQSKRTFENITFGNVSYHQSTTNKYWNFAYGAFAHFGQIKFNENNLSELNTVVDEFNEIIPIEPILEPGTYTYGGGGISAEVDVTIPLGKYVDWRITGIKATLLYENGSYAKFRKEIIQKYEFIDDLEREGFNEEGGFFTSRTNTRADLNPDDLSINVSSSSSLIIKLKKGDLGLTTSFGLGHQRFTFSSSFYYSQNKITGFLGFHRSIQGTIFRSGIAYRLE